MDANLTIYLMIGPYIYFTAVLICWFVAFGKSHGFLASGRAIFSLSGTPSKAFLFGAFPGGVLTSIAMIFFPNLGIVTFAPFIVGAVISTLILHRDLLSMVDETKKWNIAIGTLCALLAIAFYSLLPSFFSHL